MTLVVPAARYRRYIRLSSLRKRRGEISGFLYFRKIGGKIERFLALPGAPASVDGTEPSEERFRDVPYPAG